MAAAVIFGDFPFIDFLLLDNNCGITRYRVAKFGKKTLKVSKVISIKNEIDKHFIYSHRQRPLFGIIEFKNIVTTVWLELFVERKPRSIFEECDHCTAIEIKKHFKL